MPNCRGSICLRESTRIKNKRNSKVTGGPENGYWSCGTALSYASHRKASVGCLPGPRGYPIDSSSGPRGEGGVGNFEKNETVTELMRKERLHGLHTTGFLEYCKIVWLLDTGFVRNILSHQTNKRLHKTLQFLHEEGTSGRWAEN